MARCYERATAERSRRDNRKRYSWWPPGDVTLTSTVPAGTMALIVVLPITENDVAGVPPNETALARAKLAAGDPHQIAACDRALFGSRYRLFGVTLAGDHIDQNAGGGLIGDGTGGSGPIRVAVGDSSASQNAGNGIAALGGSASVNIDVTHTAITGNANGIQSQGTPAKITVGNSQISQNGTAIQTFNGGTVLSYTTNQMSANQSSGNPPGSASLQ